MKIESWGLAVLARLLVPELHRNVRFVGALIFRESDVSIDSEQGAAIGSRVGNQTGAYRLERGSRVSNESQTRLLDHPLVSILVLSKPGPVIVPGQISKELEQVRREV